MYCQQFYAGDGYMDGYERIDLLKRQARYTWKVARGVDSLSVVISNIVRVRGNTNGRPAFFR